MTRLISGIALAAAALAAILFLPLGALRVVAGAVAVLAAHEYLRILRAGRPAWSSIPLLLTFATCLAMLSPTAQDILALLLVALGWMAIEVVLLDLTIEQAAARAVTPWYLGMPLGMLVAVHDRGGRSATLLLLATIVVSDTAQYYSGRLLGRHALAPTISPKKTIEGAIGGLIVGTLFMAIAGSRVLPSARPPFLALLGFMMVVLGIFGDLFESRLKRDAAMKDSSALIPGHGGVLDRIDALLFAIPAFYIYLIRLT